jgi:hypothetical protein
MDRPRTLRLLRIAFSAGCGILCLLLIVHWVRSFRLNEIVTKEVGGKVTTIGSGTGTAYFVRIVRRPVAGMLLPPPGWRLISNTATPVERSFMWTSSASLTFVQLPYWCLIATCIGFAAVPWATWRFSLRTLLIVTTLTAVILGAIVYAVK